MMVASQVKVLVIDDETSIRESLSAFLEDFDFLVSASETAEKALQLILENEFDLAIVDLRLPGMDGDALITKAHKIQPNLRYIIYTGSTEYNLPHELQEIGMSPEHVYLKPLLDLNLIVNGINTMVHTG